MSRVRAIKPGFFLNEQLAELSPLTRILFAGLWTLADREGRLEDRPRRIKAAVLPYDRCRVNQMLDELKNAGFITRYAINGSCYIAVNKWKRHQYPHVKEPASTIPAPVAHDADTMSEPVEPVGLTVNGFTVTPPTPPTGGSRTRPRKPRKTEDDNGDFIHPLDACRIDVIGHDPFDTKH